MKILSCKVNYDKRTNKKKGDYFRGRIRPLNPDDKHLNHSERFEYESDAITWVDDVKKAIMRGDCIKRFCTSKISLAELIKKTLKARKTSLTQQEQSTIHCMLKYNIAKRQLNKLTKTDIVQFARDLSVDGTRKPQTVSGYISYLGNVLEHAEAFTGIKASSDCVKESWKALRDGNLVDKQEVRDRVISDDEDSIILEECERIETSPNSQIPYAKIYRITLAQSLRRSALVGTLRRKHIDFKGNRIKVDKQQNRRTNKGEPQWCPMLPETRQVLAEMGFHEHDGVDRELVIFPYNSGSVSAGFRRILKKVGLEDIQVFRDGRRTAITNLDNAGLSLAEIRIISTHSENSKTLEKVYIHSNVKNVAMKVAEKLPSRKQKSTKLNEQEFHQQAATIVVDMLKNIGNSPEDILAAVKEISRPQTLEQNTSAAGQTIFLTA